ncbi:hypothetical protein COO60DRAFT_1709612 [Scenedesmus sp. NREL 46B-D3]|nr:hypothetical protein COO60DRAFT_1709612 [Scenedesmus sp. NREL 46B-D3]
MKHKAVHGSARPPDLARRHSPYKRPRAGDACHHQPPCLRENRGVVLDTRLPAFVRPFGGLCKQPTAVKGLLSSTSALATLAPVPAITWALCNVCGTSPLRDKVSVKLKHAPVQGRACHVVDVSASRLWRSGACCTSLQRCMAFNSTQQGLRSHSRCTQQLCYIACGIHMCCCVKFCQEAYSTSHCHVDLLLMTVLSLLACQPALL